MQKKKRLGILLILCCVIVGVLAYHYRPETATGEKEISIQVVHGTPQETAFYSYTTEAEYLGEALQEQNLIDGEEGPYGLFVTTVDGETADESKQEWWCLTKGGEMVQTGVDTTPIADKDQFELTLTTGY